MALERLSRERLLPEPGSPAERTAFARLQAQLTDQYRHVFPDETAARTVVVVPSLSLDEEVMARITGVHFYEERMLSMLMLLRLPRTRLIYLSSQPIADEIIDYYLHLLHGIPAQHARRRLTLLSCFDGSAQPLTAKILARPRLLARIDETIENPATAHLACFTVSALERTLAVRLGMPIYGCDPDLRALGSKSGGRRIMREAGLSIPDGIEDLADGADIAAALVELKARNHGLRRAVVKLNEGFSGEGNAVFDFTGAPAGASLAGWVRERLAGVGFAAPGMKWDTYEAKVREMGAIVEAFVEGAVKQSPSAQFRIDPLGTVEAISTHDQVLGGAGGQVFLGCRFPAADDYRLRIQAEGRKVADALRDRGVLGRFGIDFLAVQTGAGWQLHAIEINLRKGGTTHPFMMLQYLTGGTYDAATGLFHAPGGGKRFYYATDNLEGPQYRGLTPHDLVDIAVLNGLHFNGAAHDGVVFHLIGALSEFGKVGVVCVSGSPEGADRLYRHTVDSLDRAQEGVGR
jgi:hypothetical protein